ncbi:ABATE domain-containing protein [Actinoplanes oblitus]|uniref:ABATE domain-containing protein n=1 Tax=Actinoplanes oblitus TaxID=3040509 RepID=A0ABY8W8L3_9ACTN|nr:ABATE domain-containing protein [Actinoplanes oblitus]WIM93393.1 ABATE domain-containing protein [Actinoplanes oblitus]
MRSVIDAAPGADRHPGLDLANSRLVAPGNQVTDLLDGPEAATRWLIDRGLAPADAVLQEICAGRLRAMRSQIRALLTARVAGAAPPAEALAAVNAAMTRVPTAAELRWDPVRGLHRATPHPTDQVVDRALGTLAADIADLLTGADADRLTACDSPPCRRFLLRSGRRQFCSIRCGDRARAARAYARRPR